MYGLSAKQWVCFYFEQLYANGERRFRAQTPNRGEFYFVKDVEKTRFDDNPSSLAVQMDTEKRFYKVLSFQ